jgi:hypothetical protein
MASRGSFPRSGPCSLWLGACREYDYLDLGEHLPDADMTALLGAPFGPPGAYFDPGRQGSYFQTPQEVVGSLTRVQRIDLSDMDEDQRRSLPRFKKLLEECAKAVLAFT